MVSGVFCRALAHGIPAIQDYHEAKGTVPVALLLLVCTKHRSKTGL